MTILLYKDGKLIVDTEQPLEGVSLDNLAAILSGASDGDVIQYDATNGMWVNKSAPSSLPEVTASDKGKYLKANESTGDPEWASGGSSGGVLVVNTTFADDTYTCDKTAAEMWGGAQTGVVLIKYVDGRGADNVATVCNCYFDELSGYSFQIVNGADGYIFSATTGMDYPSYEI